MVLLARLLTVVLIAIVLFDPQTAARAGAEAADRDRKRWRRRHRGPRRDAGRHPDAAQRRQRGRRRGGGGRRARRDRAVLVRHRRRRVHGHPHRAREGHHDRRARDRAGHDAPDSFWENGAPLAFNDARYSGMSAGIPGTPPPGSAPSSATAPGRSRERCEPGIRVARDGFTVDQTFFDQTTPNIDWFNDIPSTAAIYLDPDGTPRDVGTTLQNPDLARTYRRSRRDGSGRVLPRPAGRARWPRPRSTRPRPPTPTTPGGPA